MASIVIPLPEITVSSGGTVGDRVWDVSDAVSVTFGVRTATTATVLVEVGLQTTSTTFFPLVVPWRSDSTSATLAAATSSGLFVLNGTSFSLIRFTTTAASTGNPVLVGSKQIRT